MGQGPGTAVYRWMPSAAGGEVWIGTPPPHSPRASVPNRSPFAGLPIPLQCGPRELPSLILGPGFNSFLPSVVTGCLEPNRKAPLPPKGRCPPEVEAESETEAEAGVMRVSKGSPNTESNKKSQGPRSLLAFSLISPQTLPEGKVPVSWKREEKGGRNVELREWLKPDLETFDLELLPINP